MSNKRLSKKEKYEKPRVKKVFIEPNLRKGGEFSKLIAQTPPGGPGFGCVCPGACACFGCAF